jgi:O-antigen/teichoic acid export membrane protein
VAVIMVLALLTVPFLPFPERVREGLVLAIAGSLLGVVALFPTAFFQVHLRLGLAVATDLVVRGLALLLMVLVVVFDKGFIALVATTPIAWAAGVVIAFLLSRRFWHPNVRFDPVELRRLVGIAAPVTLGLVHFKVDAVMMSFLKPAADVGIYTIAYAAVEQSLILPALFLAAVFPILTRLVHAGDLASGDVVDKSFRFLTVLGLLVAVLVFTLAVPFVHLVANESYAAAVTPLQILAFSIVPLFAGAVFANLLVSMGDLRDLAVVSAVLIVVNVTLNLYFIPAYSYNGAAGTTVFSELLGFVMIYAVARRATRAPLARETVMRGALLVAVVVAVVVPTLWLPWWLAAPLAVCVCVVASIGTRTVTRADLRLLLHRVPAPAPADRGV